MAGGQLAGFLESADAGWCFRAAIATVLAIVTASLNRWRRR